MDTSHPEQALGAEDVVETRFEKLVEASAGHKAQGQRIRFQGSDAMHRHLYGNGWFVALVQRDAYL